MGKKIYYGDCWTPCSKSGKKIIRGPPGRTVPALSFFALKSEQDLTTTATNLSFDAADPNNGNVFTNSALTVPVGGGGMWMLTTNINFVPRTLGTYTITITVNGTFTTLLQTITTAESTNSSNLNISSGYFLDDGDVVRLTGIAPATITVFLPGSYFSGVLVAFA
jgi:hypothetical protein